MRRHIKLDAIGGVAGDMFVSAMADAFPLEGEAALKDVAAILPATLRPTLRAVTRHGITARHFTVEGEGPPAPTTFEGQSTLIEAAPLPELVRDGATDILRRLAETEAAIHGIDVHSVHFHEIAEWDTLADVVAAASLLTRLENPRFAVSPLPLGAGRIQSRHGPLPVPAPAAAKLLEGFDVVDDGIGGERVTPTGAAILASLSRSPLPRAPMRLATTGHGAGTRQMEGVANILRVLVLEESTAAPDTDLVAVIAFAVDDMTGEEIAIAADRLRAVDGVLDLTLTPRLGKKGRPEHLFELLTRPDARDTVVTRCFEETTTIGLRHRLEQRATLPRQVESAETGGRTVRRKRTARPGGETLKVEAGDVADGKNLAERRRASRKAEDAP
ncbi:MAG: LarC family nickel insertion protein [Pseudomonadota bacterium]